MIPTVTQEQRDSFAEKGYAIFENVFTPDEMNELAAQIEAHQKRHEEALQGEGRGGGDFAAGGNYFHVSSCGTGRRDSRFYSAS